VFGLFAVRLTLPNTHAFSLFESNQNEGQWLKLILFKSLSYCCSTSSRVEDLKPSGVCQHSANLWYRGHFAWGAPIILLTLLGILLSLTVVVDDWIVHSCYKVGSSAFKKTVCNLVFAFLLVYVVNSVWNGVCVCETNNFYNHYILWWLKQFVLDKCETVECNLLLK